MSLTREQKQEARLLRASDPRAWKWAALGRRYGVHPQTVRRAIDLNYAIERCREWRDWWRHKRREGATA